jgi:hypothetical protein
MVARHRQGLRHQKGEQSETGCGNLNSLGWDCLRRVCSRFRCFRKSAGDASIHG